MDDEVEITKNQTQKKKILTGKMPPDVETALESFNKSRSKLDKLVSFIKNVVMG